nr:hypothetical protein [uncultured Mediterranean phage uvMED]
MRKKMIMLIGLSIALLQGCAKYEPLVDTRGRSGTYNESRAEEITNDKLLCSQFAKNNTTKMSNVTYWIFSPKMETRYQAYYKQCLTGRGHSVIN